MRERRPGWLRVACQDGNIMRLHAVRCTCGRWTIQSRNGIWQSYDPGIITGSDLTTAIILHTPLTRFTWDDTLQQPILRDVCGDSGIHPDGLYLAMHSCRRQPISRTPYKPPPHHTPDDTDYTDIPEPTPDELIRFQAEWNKPKEGDNNA